MTGLTLRQRFSPRRFFGGLGPAPGPQVTRAGNIYILPTRQGLGFLVALALMLVAAINYVNSLAFAFTFLLAGVGITGIVHTWRNLHGLVLRVQPPEPVHAGTAPALTLIVDNPGDPRPALELDAGHRDTPRRFLAESGQTAARLDLPPARRGRHSLPSFEVSTRFPLGLFRAWVIVHAEGDYLVWPRPAAEAPPPARTGSGHGSRPDPAPGQDDFAGLRPFRRGDSLHHVHWKVAARSPELPVKVFQGERDEEVLLDWDRLPPVDAEQRLSLLCRQILDAEAAGQRYGLRLPGVAIAPGRGTHHRRRCLDALALWGSDAP